MNETIPQDILDAEQIALKEDAILYNECLNNKPLHSRTTKQEIRDGLILYWHVYRFIKDNP